jgi:hypothetical protein
MTDSLFDDWMLYVSKQTNIKPKMIVLMQSQGINLSSLLFSLTLTLSSNQATLSLPLIPPALSSKFISLLLSLSLPPGVNRGFCVFGPSDC